MYVKAKTKQTLRGNKMDTKQVLVSMLKENTGRHMCDSGGAYGRNWEKNQEKDFDSEPEVQLEVWSDDNKVKEFYPIVSVYHYLLRYLEFDSEMQDQFDAFSEGSDSEYSEDIEGFLDHLRSIGEVTGLYGEGDVMRDNTYNSENPFSQEFIYTYFEFNGDAYTFIEIHGGCDVRGGYSSAKIFNFNQCYDEASFFCWNDFTLFDSSENNWYTDDRSHWYNDGCAGAGADPQLETYELKCNDKDEIISPLDGSILQLCF